MSHLLSPLRQSSTDRTPLQTVLLTLLFVAGFLGSGRPGLADELPLHLKVDELLKRTQVTPVAAPASDSVFLRRVFLDLIGRIPTIDETRKFLADEDSNKRSRLVDDLLARDDFNRHMAVTFDLMLMERRGGKHVKSADFRKYLEESFAQNKSFLTLTREILAADGTDEKNRPASAFYLERDVAPDLLTREIGRVFFGVDLQCAQCHNHPNIDDYHQEDYYGIQAFLVRASLFQPDKKQPATIAEKAEGEAAFQSVFTDRSSMTGPRVLDGEELIEVSLKPGERYQVEPAKNVRPIPKESRVAKLALVTTSQPTDAFNRNIANRLWAHMLGRGLVHPVDLHHSANPPSHPELLKLLAADFVTRQYDVKSFLREIALSEVYQRQSTLQPQPVPVEETQQQISELEAESKAQLELSFTAGMAVTTATETLDAVFAELTPLHAEIEKANKAVEAAIKARDEVQAKVDKSTQAVIAKQKAAELVANAFGPTKIAAEALKDDKDLASAVALLLKKKDGLGAEVATLQAAEQTEKAALVNANEALKTTHTQVDAALAAAQPVEVKVRELRAKLIEERKLAAQHREAAAIAAEKANSLKSLVEFSQLLAKIENFTKTIPQLAQQLQTRKTQLPEFEKNVSEQQANYTAAQQALQNAGKLVVESSTLLGDQKTTAALLNESLQKLNEAAQRIAGENPLSASKSEIALSIENLTKQIDTTQSTLIKLQEQQATETKNVSAAELALKDSQAKHAQQTQMIAKLQNELTHSKTELQKASAAQQSLAETLLAHAADHLDVAEVVQLSPEQLGISVLVATGQSDSQRAAETAKLNKETPISEEDKKDAAKVAARERAIDTATQLSLNNRLSSFLSLFGASAGQPQHIFFATADQALFFSNGNEIRSWLVPASGNLTDRLMKNESPQEISNELYLSVLCRSPTTEEVQAVSDYLQKRTDAKAAAVQELAWALITSVEFRFEY